MQSILCTPSKLAWTCRESFARSLPMANRVQGSLHAQGARLAVQIVLCTSSQLTWTCKECFARSSFPETQSIHILVPKIRYQVPRPSNDQIMSQTTSFQLQKRRFLDGAGLQDLGLTRCWHWPSPHRNESRPDRVEGGLYVQRSYLRRAEGALYVQPTSLDV